MGTFFILMSSCDFSSNIHKDILYAQELIKNQEFSKAISLYTKILSKNPSNTIKLKILFQLGDLHSLYLSDHKQANIYFNKILETTNDPLWQVKTEEKIGEINYSFLKNYKISEKSYRKLVIFTPKLENYDFYEYRLAQSLLNNHKHEEAVKILSKISKNINHEFYVSSFFQLGMSAYLSKNWKQSIDYWKEYLKRENQKEKIVEAKFLIANAYETMELLKEAYNIYSSILPEYPNSQIIQEKLRAIYERRVARKR